MCSSDLTKEDVWQTRFLAPVDLPDGTHTVRLLLRDRSGRVFRETKTFVIASKPPTVRVKLDKAAYRRGEVIELKVAASASTRTLIARMYGSMPAYLHWNPSLAMNTGQLVVPSHLPAGKYKLTVSAEDMAHNIGTQEVALEVLP